MSCIRNTREQCKNERTKGKQCIIKEQKKRNSTVEELRLFSTMRFLVENSVLGT